MLNERVMLLGIFFVLFVASTALGQSVPSQSDAALGNPTLSESDVVTIIKEIHASETRTLNHLDKKFDELNTKIGDLNINVAVLDKEVSNLKWLLSIIATAIIIPLVFLLQWRE
jgi:TolA-binding protein